MTKQEDLSMNMKDIEQKLRHASYKQAKLYFFCNFIALMIITAYSLLMKSPTILTILPEGGDSRRQMYMIFALTLFGCVVFTIYAASLFFRKKTRQIGILMALGASKKSLVPGIFREVLTLSSLSSLSGMLAGIPLIYLLWNSFQLLVESSEMTLHLDYTALFLSGLFILLVIVVSCVTADYYLSRTNIIDVIQEEHRNEPVKQLGKWCGPLGLLLILIGAVLGYSAPGIWLKLFHRYPSVFVNLFYAPIFVGLYLVMLHTVVHGWRSNRKDPYRNIISRSMMKFQGKQTVNNLLVSTVLIAGACFAIFYIPMLATGQLVSVSEWEFDYMYDYRMDQTVPSPAEIEEMAASHNMKLKDWKEIPYITLAQDGENQVEDENNSFHYEYQQLLGETKYVSESAFNQLTGQTLDVLPGTFRLITNKDDNAAMYAKRSDSILTNMNTRQTLSVTYEGLAYFSMLTGKVPYYVLDDKDYAEISQDLSSEWMGMARFFNADGEDMYPFANEFFHTFVKSFGPECEYPAYYDRVYKIAANERGEIYWGDTNDMTKISLSQPDSSDFRAYWAFMPKFRSLDMNDFMNTFAVYLMTFLFIFTVCVTTACIICYTRCQTIALNNRYIFDDLKRLGASPDFLNREVQVQCKRVYHTPTAVGMTMMFLLYFMIMYANDGRISIPELAGMAACALILIFIMFLIYLIYRKTVTIMKRELDLM